MNLIKTAGACSVGLLAATTWAAEPPPKVSLIGRAVPEIDSLPEGPYRALVTQGHELSTRTFAVISPEVKNPRKRYAGNNLACTSCHQAGGAKPFAIPWVGVTATFPQYRGREDQISTVEERINGCMERSMNGKPLPHDAPEMKAFTTYIAFLSQGVPVARKSKAPRFCRVQCPTGAPTSRRAASSTTPSARYATAPMAWASARASGATPWATRSRRCGARTASTTAPA